MSLSASLTHPLASHAHIFSGPPAHPFLAPRGVHWSAHGLCVADTGRHQVLIWKKWHGGLAQAPDVVLGTGSPCAAPSATCFHYPSGLWAGAGRLVVADARNHRVLIWNQFPEENGQPADLVLGQPCFADRGANLSHLNALPSAQSLHWPYGVCSDGERLWIADTGNRRILYYAQWPTESFQPADAVIGQADFGSKAITSSYFTWPYSVKIGPEGQLAVTDTGAFRVLLWQDYRQAFQQPADTLIGQAGFDHNSPNQEALFPGSHTLNWCYDTEFVQQGIWVADAGNHRLLGWDQLPRQHNSAAPYQVGEGAAEAGERMFDWPFALSAYRDQLAVADTGHRRVVILRMPGAARPS